MVVCQFYLRDQCKFGASCRNEHPDPKPSGFATNAAWGTSNTSSAAPSVTFNVESIQRDFGPAEKPLWPTSSYGCGKYEPTFLTGLDISPEELRARAVEALKEGKGTEYSQYETSVIANASAQYARVSNDAKGAFEAAFQLSKSASGAPVPATTAAPPTNPAFGGGSTSAFGASTFGQPSTSAFGQSAFGQPKPAFGTSAFGQPAASTPAFGQPTASTSTFGQSNSAFGSTSTAPAFGQSAFGAATTKPAFGTSAFGQPATSAFGASTNPSTSAFGASTSTPGSAFGSTTGAASGGGGFAAFAAKPAAFGQSTFGQSAFGAVAASATGGTPAFAQPDTSGTSAFGSGTAQPFSSSTTTQPFGASTFGSSTTTNPLNSGGGGFGAFASSGPTAFGASSAAPSNPFGQSQANASSNPLNPSGTTTSAFGQPVAPATNPFGQSTTASQTQTNPLNATSAFGQSSFGQPSATPAFGQPSQPANPFGQASQPANPFGQSTGVGLSGGFGSMGLGSSTLVTPTPPSNPFGPRLTTNPLESSSAFGASTAGTAAPASAFGTSTPVPSAFGAASASSAFGAPPQAAAAPSVFASVPTGGAGRPIHDPYASLLPPNYLDMLPKEVKEAFASDRFVFGEGQVGVPWWIPPLEMR